MRSKLLLFLLLPVATFAASLTQSQSFDVACLQAIYGPFQQAACPLNFQKFDSSLGTLQSVTLETIVDVHAIAHEFNQSGQAVSWDPTMSLQVLSLFPDYGIDPDYWVKFTGPIQTIQPYGSSTFTADFAFDHTFQLAKTALFIGDGVIAGFSVRDVIWSATFTGDTSFTGTTGVTLTYNYTPPSTFTVQQVPDLGSTALLLAVGLLALKYFPRGTHLLVSRLRD